MARVTYNLNTLQDLYRQHFAGGSDNNNAYSVVNINQLRRNVIRTNNSRKLSYCVPCNGTLNKRS